jgi:H+/Cl- antiporter ClcA
MTPHFMGPDPAPPPATDPLVVLRSRGYVRLLILAALIGVPVSAASYGFLVLVDQLQTLIYEDLPDALGFDTAPAWWPLPVLVLSGVLVALAIIHLPGTGGHRPTAGFKGSGPVAPADLPGIVLAALAGLGGGIVLGPEAPLILLGAGLGVLALRLVNRDAPPQTAAVVASAGSFAAISSLVGSPLIGAFLLLEVAGLAAPMIGLVLVPGLLSAGIGSLVFVGLNSITGLGTFSLTISNVPPFDALTVAMLAWAVAFGVVAPFAGLGITRLAIWLQARIEPRMLVGMPLAGAVVAGLAIGFGEATDKASSAVLFSGQTGLGPLIADASTWSVGALLLLLACKGLAYAVSLSCFRGGPIFPAVFIGAAAGVAASHLPGMELVPAVAMGIGAMSTVMLKLPLTSALLATVLLGADGPEVTPVVIIAVVVAYAVSVRLEPPPAAA